MKPNEKRKTSYDTGDTSFNTPSYKTRLLNFVNTHLSEEACETLYKILSHLFENNV